MNLLTNYSGRAATLAGLDFEFGDIVPTVNGIAVDTPVMTAVDNRKLAWTVPGGGRFALELDAGGSIPRIQWTLADFPPGRELLRLGLVIRRIGQLRAYLRNGYFSWDGSYFVQPADEVAQGPLTGFAVTALLPAGTEQAAITLGFERHERFQQTFTFAPRGEQLTIETLWDNAARPADQICAGEWLTLRREEGIEDALRGWAVRVAAAASRPPRLGSAQIRGWCSWYNLYGAATAENIREHLRGVSSTARARSLPMEVFQIDDGFTPEMGDWLATKPEFPGGMKGLLDEIRAEGFVPGLWIAPFMVGNRSRLYREHPDWVVRDRRNGGPLAHMKFYGEFRWHKRSEEYYILDTTLPEALDYLRRVFRIWRSEWGCGYFKTDFMHFGSEYGPDRAVWHQPGLTRIEIWRRTAEAIREEIGGATWLGCGCPLWASVGLVDGMRIGRDIGVEWKGNYSAQSLLRDQATRNAGNGVLWQADPDCILLRSRFHHLTDAEVESLACYAGLVGGVVMTSDALDELSEPRVRLWKALLELGKGQCRFPLLGRAGPEGGAIDPVIVQVRRLGNEQIRTVVKRSQ